MFKCACKGFDAPLNNFKNLRLGAAGTFLGKNLDLHRVIMESAICKASWDEKVIFKTIHSYKAKAPLVANKAPHINLAFFFNVLALYGAANFTLVKKFCKDFKKLCLVILGHLQHEANLLKLHWSVQVVAYEVVYFFFSFVHVLYLVIGCVAGFFAKKDWRPNLRAPIHLTYILAEKL